MFYRPHPRVAIDFTETHSLAKQSFAAECDINNILKKFEKTGMVEHVKQHHGHYGDFIDAPDYLTAMTAIVEAQEAFDSLPANVRKRFANDPAQFLEFVHDPDNRDEMQKLGLLEPVQEATPPAPTPKPEEPVGDTEPS